VSTGAAAERYARAIFELGSESGQLDRLTQEIAEFAASFQEQAGLRRTLENPVLEEVVRERVLRQVARHSQYSPLATNSLLVLLRRRRLGELPAIARRLRTLADEKNGVSRAKIVSAGSLPESYFNQLKQRLEGALGRRVIVEHEEDPSLIGGVLVRVGDNTFDGSIKGRLEELERRLLAPL
jgi:F-type H+-transporting ATPase subunit delta